MAERKKQLYSLIPLKKYKALLNIDDREDGKARLCLEAASASIEKYCKRQLLRTTHTETIDYYGELILPLSEYPIQEILAVYINSEILEPDFYNTVPDCRADKDILFTLRLSPALRRLRNLKTLEITYIAGYTQGKVPPDLETACLELAAWNMNRYKSNRIGMTGSVRGGGKDGEHFEQSMPLQVRQLLEPFRRKTI